MLLSTAQHQTLPSSTLGRAQHSTRQQHWGVVALHVVYCCFNMHSGGSHDVGCVQDWQTCAQVTGFCITAKTSAQPLRAQHVCRSLPSLASSMDQQSRRPQYHMPHMHCNKHGPHQPGLSWYTTGQQPSVLCSWHISHKSSRAQCKQPDGTLQGQ